MITFPLIGFKISSCFLSLILSPMQKSLVLPLYPTQGGKAALGFSSILNPSKQLP